jgi:hypothetical protein
MFCVGIYLEDLILLLLQIRRTKTIDASFLAQRLILPIYIYATDRGPVSI